MTDTRARVSVTGVCPFLPIVLPCAAMSFADVETSSDDYASRFSGSAGEWLLSVQSKIVLSLIRERAPQARTLLDVGGGHGQIVQAIRQSDLKENLTLTVVGSTDQADGQIRSLVIKGECDYKIGDLVKLPFADRSFDIVTSFRLVPHCPEWKALIAELCRVSKLAVIVDYPTAQSLNALTPMLFAWKKKLEGNTRTYDLFSHHEIAQSFSACGFSRLTRRGEFFWPMVIHRKLKCPPLSGALEWPFATTGVSNQLGSPIVICAERKERE